MKIHEYNEMMAYLTRPGKAQGGVIGKGGMFQGEDLGYRTGFRVLTEAQKEARRAYSRKKHAEKIASRVFPSFNILGKKVTLPKGFNFGEGVGIEQSRTSIEQGFKNLQKWLKNPTPENWVKYFKKSMFGLQFRKYLLGQTEGPKMGAVTKFLDTINIKKRLSKSQINKINELTTGGKGVSLRSIGVASNNPGNLKYTMSEVIETIRDFQNGEKWLKANSNPDAIDPVTGKNIYRQRARSIRTMINEQSRLGGFPFGDNSEKKLWSNLYRASYRGDRIKIVGEFANGELPINPETGKVDWKMKNKNNVAAWKRVQFIDTQAPKQAVFKWGKNFQKGDFKKQIDKVFGNGFFDKSTAAYDVQAATGSKRLSSGVTIKHDLKNRILKVDLLTQDIKAGNKISNIPTKEEIDAYIKKKSPRFNLTEVHHPMGVGRDPYLTEPAFRFANRKLAKVEDAIRAGTMTLADAKVEIDNINKKIGPIRIYLDDGYYGSKGGATQKSILESANKMIKTLLSSADKPTIMAIRKALGCGLASGGRVGLQGGGNLLECPMAKFAQDPEGTLNIVGKAVPETRTPIMNAFKKLGMGTLKWGARGFIGLGPVFGVMTIQDVAKGLEEGLPAGEVAAQAIGEWTIPGMGEWYKEIQRNKMMKDIATPDELISLEKSKKYNEGKALLEGSQQAGIRHGSAEAQIQYAKELMEKNQPTDEDSKNIFKLIQKQETTYDLQKEERKGMRKERQEEFFEDLRGKAESYGYDQGGRVGFGGGGVIKLVKGAAWVIKNLKKQLLQFEKEDFMGKLANISSAEKNAFKNEITTLIKQLEEGGAIPHQMLETMRKDKRFKDVIKTEKIKEQITDSELKELEEVLLDYGKNVEQKETLKQFDVTGLKKHASGGRVGFDEGSKPKSPGRRAFIKGITALAALPLVGRYFKLGKVLEKAQPYTGPAMEKIKGMPEWFPGLVKKLWNEGEDVTKQVAYKDRQVVKRGTLEGGDDVDMIYDIDTGDVSINVTPKQGKYETTSGAYNKEYSLDFKKGEIIEEGKYAGSRSADDFAVGEVKPSNIDPDGNVDWDADYVDIDDAMTDLSELENFAKKK